MIVGLMLVKNHSTRLENKNLKIFADGLSLFEFSLKANLRVYPQLFNRFIVYSNNTEVKEICAKYPEVEFIEEDDVLGALDDTWVVIKHLITIAGLKAKDILVYVPPTTPLRTHRDILLALTMFVENKNIVHSVVSVKKAQDQPEWTFKLNSHGYLKLKEFPYTSQELTPHYLINGSIYIGVVERLVWHNGFFFYKVLPYIMPPERSINIDTEADFELARYYYNKTEVKRNG